MYSACRLNSPTNSFVVERFCCDVADYLNRFSFLTFRYNFVEMTKWTRKWFWSENLVQTWSSFSFSIFNPVGTKRCQISNGGKHQDAASGFLEVFLCGLKVLHFSNINPFLPSVICPPVEQRASHMTNRCLGGTWPPPPQCGLMLMVQLFFYLIVCDDSTLLIPSSTNKTQTHRSPNYHRAINPQKRHDGLNTAAVATVKSN